MSISVGIDEPHVTSPATSAGSGSGLNERADFRFKNPEDALRCFRAAKDAAATEYRKVIGIEP